MAEIEFDNAYFIKLGRSGLWEKDSIETGKMRIGWRGQTIEDINNKRWGIIEKQLRTGGQKRQRDQGTITRDFNALKIIAESSSKDVWITFYQNKMWWARLHGPVEEDKISKFRRVSGEWSDRSSDGEKLLIVNELPGVISKIQGFRGTACRVREPHVLHRVINNTKNALSTKISQQRTELAATLEQAIRDLHWKDFEILVDMIFRASGWTRISVLGQHDRDYDIAFQEDITGNLYVVQVKSTAGLKELLATASQFSTDDYEKVFFAVHSPRADIKDLPSDDLPEHIQLLTADRIGELALEAGLINWIEQKIA